jgi:WD40 repeat protein
MPATFDATLFNQLQGETAGIITGLSQAETQSSALTLSGPARKVNVYAYDFVANAPLPRSRDWYDELPMGAVGDLSVDPEGRWVALASEHGVATYRLTRYGLDVLAFSGNEVGSVVAATRNDREWRFAVRHSPRSLGLVEAGSFRYHSSLRAGSAEYSQSSAWCKLAVSPDYQFAALATWGRPLELRDLKTGHTLASVNEWARELQWTHDGRRLLIITLDSQLRLVEIDDLIRPQESFQPDEMFPLEPPPPPPPPPPAATVSFPVFCARFSPDDKWCALSGASSGLSIHRVEAKGLIADRTLPPSKQTIFSTAFNRQGTLLAAGDLQGHIWLWNTATWQATSSLPTPKGEICILAFSPDDQYLVSAMAGGTITFWRTANWSNEFELVASDGVLSLTFSADGKLLITGDRRGRLSVWDVDHRRLSLRWKGHGTGITSAFVSPESHDIVTGTFNGSIVSWHLDELQKSLRKLNLE